MGKLTIKAIESLCFGPFKEGERKDEYRMFRLEGTEWNSDNDKLPNDKGQLRRKYHDGEGLYLRLEKSGTKSWLLDYSFGGKRKTISLGSYPTLSLADAREACRAKRALLAQGLDPCEVKKQEKLAQKEEAKKQITFGTLAKEFFERKLCHVKEKDSMWRRLEEQALPMLGDKAIGEISRQEVAKLCQAIDDKGLKAIPKKVLSLINRILNYAMDMGVIELNPCLGLSRTLKTHKAEHHPHISDPKFFGDFLFDCEQVKNQMYETKQCLILAPYIFARPSELVGMRWDEIDFDKALWILPPERMKKGKLHKVPLSRQVVEKLKEIQTVNGDKEFVFYSSRSKLYHITRDSINKIMHTMAGRHHYHSKVIDFHGLRGTASTMLREELHYSSDLIERELSHAVGDESQQAYDHSTRLEERRSMMQAWADYLDDLRNAASSTLQEN
ncbi:MAG: tyrosine-type recombinase/integrase [Desulfovibrio sp.]|nr:tyrosine-type recombinase/integrase [Desulfovibrio sp.]